MKWLLRTLAFIVVVLAVLYLRFAILAEFNHDEVEHAHVGFKLSQGLIPYRDFYQNHPPAYWLLTLQEVRRFPFSLNALFAGRAVSALALLGCWLLGFRLLAGVPGGRTRLARLVYTWAVLLCAYRYQFALARPDALMVLLGTASLCLLPRRGLPGNGRVVLLGALGGLGASLSPKLGPILLVIPGLLMYRAWRDRRRFVTGMFSYMVGLCLALLPTFWWLREHGLLGAFVFDVIQLNREVSKPWSEMFHFLHNPIFIPALAGMAAWVGTKRVRMERSNAFPVLCLWFVAGAVLAVMARHGNPYNMQVMTVPVAVGTACLAVLLWTRVRGAGLRVLFLVVLLGYPTVWAASSLARIRDYTGISHTDLQRLIDLAESGRGRCTAFSPWHPIFCADVSGLSNAWDLEFAERVHGEQQVARFRNLWRKGLQQTVERQPEIIVRRAEVDFWNRAKAAGMITESEAIRLDALRPNYEVLQIGEAEVWLRGGSSASPERDAASEEVTYTNGDMTLAATLIVPSGSGPFPGAVLVHGSGTSDRSNPWTAAYAQALVERGIAVLHPDKRGSGESGGDWRTATFTDLADDAVAGLRRLCADPRVDTTRVGLIGFSQGGDVVPLAASRCSQARFVVDVSGSVVPLMEQIGDELRKMGMQADLGHADINTVLSIHRLGVRFALTGEGWDDYAGALARAKAGRLGGLEVVEGFPTQPEAPAWNFLRTVGNFDPMPYWKSLQVPVLFLYGGKDENVDVFKSADYIETELTPTGLSYSLLLFRNNGHGLFRDDAMDFLARWIRDRGVD